MKMFSDIGYDADVLIAGGGPSGSMCAYYLAKAGKKVILIDSENFPRDKICGDFVSPVGLKELINIGISESDDFKKTNIITGATVYLDGKPLITKNLPNIKGLPNYGRVIPRLILDNWIVEAARKAGTQIISPCALKNYTVCDNYVMVECKEGKDDKYFIVKMLIGADGSNSKVARIMNGVKPDQGNRIVAVRAYFENVNCVSDQAELFFSSKSFPGYSWFFPVDASRANVGIGMTLEVFPKKEVNLKELLMNVIESDLSLKAKIGNSQLINKIVGWPLSVYNPNATIVKDRVLLIGDAAGLINSLNGEGIQYALQSGRWAAETVLSCLVSGNLSARKLKMFERKVRSEIGYSMSLSNIIMQLTRNRNLNPMWLALLKIITTKAKKDEKYANLAGGILSGMIPTNKAITISFLGKTFLQCIAFAFKGPYGIFKAIKKSLIFGFEQLSKPFKQSSEYWSWIKNITRASFASIRLSVIRTKKDKQ
jgi:geranylgeranyl reductase family protein